MAGMETTQETTPDHDATIARLRGSVGAARHVDDFYDVRLAVIDLRASDSVARSVMATDILATDTGLVTPSGFWVTGQQHVAGAPVGAPGRFFIPADSISTIKVLAWVDAPPERPEPDHMPGDHPADLY